VAERIMSRKPRGFQNLATFMSLAVDATLQKSLHTAVTKPKPLKRKDL